MDLVYSFYKVNQFQNVHFFIYFIKWSKLVCSYVHLAMFVLTCTFKKLIWVLVSSITYMYVHLIARVTWSNYTCTCDWLQLYISYTFCVIILNGSFNPILEEQEKTSEKGRFDSVSSVWKFTCTCLITRNQKSVVCIYCRLRLHCCP